MEPVMLTEEVRERWEPVLNLEDAEPIQDRTTANNLMRTLETTQRVLEEESTTSDVSNWDPVLINLIRRTQPSQVSNGMVGTQPMSGPTGLVFVMRVHYENNVAGGGRSETWNQNAPDRTYSGRYSTADAEALGTNNASTVSENDALTAAGDAWREMAFTIEKSTVTAESRKLKARYTRELEQDLRKIHGADAGAELVNILRGELIAEMDRENITTIRDMAVYVGAFDIDADTDGRWEAEKAKGLALFIEKQANRIALGTRRGKGNFLVTSANVAGYLDMAGKVDSNTEMGSVEPNTVGPALVGRFAGRYPLYVDPYLMTDEVLIGYKGANQYDAGYFLCPYVGLELLRAKGEEDFNPRIGFQTRYGRLEHPFGSIVPTGQSYTNSDVVRNEVPSAITDYLGWRVYADYGTGTDTNPSDGFSDTVSRPANQYFRRFHVNGL